MRIKLSPRIDAGHLDSGLALFLIFGAVIYFFDNFQRMGIPGTIFNELQNSFSASATGISMLGALYMYSSAVSVVFTGILADRFGGYKLIATGGIVVTIGALLFPLSGSLVLLGFSRVLLGFGHSTFYMGIARELARLAPKNFPMLLSFVVMAAFIGGVCGGYPFSRFTEYFGWREVMLAVGLMTLAGYCMFLIFGRGIPKYVPDKKAAKFDFGVYIKLFKIREIRFICGSYSLESSLTYALIGTIGKKFLEDFGGYPSSSSAVVISIFVGLFAFGNMVASIASRCFGNRRKIFFLMTSIVQTAVMALILLGILLRIKGALYGCALLMLPLFGSGSLYTATAADLSSDTAKGSAISLLNTCTFLLVALVGTMIGVILDMFPVAVRDGVKIYSREAYATVFGVMLVLALFALRNAARVPDTAWKQNTGNE